MQDNIPADASVRARLREAADRYVREAKVVPPLCLAELRTHVHNILQAAALDRRYESFAAVLVSNAAWQEALAAVPHNRRLLLLPQCIKHPSQCRAAIDDLGLLCAACGSCRIHDLKAEAEALGYVVLVAEGMPVVLSLIRSGQVQGVVGVSCLSALQRIYPYMESAAVPAVAVPLLQEGCEDTTFDLDWVRDLLHRHAPGARRVGMDELHHQVEAWFSPAALAEVLGEPDGPTERIAHDWLRAAGKRWRPFLVACTYAALTGRPPADMPADVRRAALAVECFHKASLVHDDIEDADDTRYGQDTLHRRYGVPLALNAGDFLIGEGYRLIGQCGEAALRAELLRAAAGGHRELCVGQGQELWWLRQPRAMSSEEVVEIFRRKTAPAFEVALRFGAACAGADGEVSRALGRYSEHLGVAYQIHDDLADFQGGPDGADASSRRPSILLALACELADGPARRRIEDLWLRQDGGQDGQAALADLVTASGAPRRAKLLLAHHMEEAAGALAPLATADLKRLLRQVLTRIFQDVAFADLPTGRPGASRP